MERNQEYRETWRRLYPEMCDRLRRDGLEAPAQTGLPHGDDLTPEDAEAEIAELERVLRRLQGQ